MRVSLSVKNLLPQAIAPWLHHAGSTQAGGREAWMCRVEMSRGCAKAERHRDGEAIGEMTEMQRNKSKVENRNDTDYDSKTKQNSKLRHKH